MQGGLCEGPTLPLTTCKCTEHESGKVEQPEPARNRGKHGSQDHKGGCRGAVWGPKRKKGGGQEPKNDRPPVHGVETDVSHEYDDEKANGHQSRDGASSASDDHKGRLPSARKLPSFHDVDAHLWEVMDRARGSARRLHLGWPAVTVGSDTVASEIRPEDLEQHRRELTGYCYRMLGSVFEADDAVQETMVRAWRRIDGFEGRSSLRSWLYRIATNVCLDMLRGRQRRALAMDLGPSGTADSFLGKTLPDQAWVTPVPDARIVPADGDPAEVAASRESVRLALITALQHLPARQRAVLILREVLRWQATEVAELLDTSVASVNSALQRARATLASRDLDASRQVVSADQQALLARYVDAFERYDIPSLVSLLHEDAVMSMPPYDFWLRGPVEMGRWFLGQGIGCRGSRLVATAANGCAAFGSYRSDGQGGHYPWAVQVIEVSGDRIVGHHNFLDTELFAAFGLPARLER